MAPVHAAWISTWEKEKRRCRIDDDAPDVFWLGRASLLFDFEPEAQQVGGRGAQPRRVVFALAALGEAQRGGAVLAKIHDDSLEDITKW